MATFDITRPRDTIRLDTDRRGAIPFTVTNVTARTIKARFDVVPDNPADRPMFTIEGGPERTLRANDAPTIRVLIAAPETAASGLHKFSLKVVDVDSPDDHYAESQSVEFTLPERQGKKSLKFPWWLIPVGVALVLLIGVGGWYLYAHPSVDDYKGQSVDVAESALRSSGMVVERQYAAAVLEKDANKPRQVLVFQQINGSYGPASGARRLKRGTQITLHYSVPMIPVKTVKRDLAVQQLLAQGFPKDQIQIVTEGTTGDLNQVDVVFYQEPDPSTTPPISSDHVVLKVRGAPVPIAVPGVSGQPVCEAANNVRSAGFNAVPQVVPRPAAIATGVGSFRAERVVPDGVVAGILPTGMQIPGTQVTLAYFGPAVVCFHRIRVLDRADMVRIVK